MAATTVVGLAAETLLRVNGLLPSLTWSVCIFGGFVTLGILGTVLLALTAPPVDPTVRVGRRSRPRRRDPRSGHTNRAAAADDAERTDERELSGV